MRDNHVICSASFWSKFKKDRKLLSTGLSPEDVAKNICWSNYWLMLYESSICFDFEEENILNDEFLQELWHAITSGVRPRETLRFCHQKNDTDETHLKLNSLILSNEYSKDGFLSISESEYLKKDELFRDSGPAVKKRKNSQWSKLLSTAVHNFNAMVIVDNYIFSDKSELNLNEILKTLLPNKINVTFHLTIVTSKENIWSENELIKRRAKVFTTIQDIRPHLSENIIVEVFAVDKTEIHDRTIITNYMWIGSGAGFDILRKNKNAKQVDSNKSTKLCAVYHKYIRDNEWRDAYNNLIEDVKNCLRKIGKSSQNRLLI